MKCFWSVSRWHDGILRMLKICNDDVLLSSSPVLSHRLLSSTSSSLGSLGWYW